MASSDIDHWQCDKTLTQCLKYMLDKRISCDVTFIVGEERQEVHAHKFMLICRSPVFHAMLQGPLAEKGKVEIPDIEKYVFQVFLRYLYTDDIDVSAFNVIEVMYCAKKYCVDRLTKRCSDFLENNITAENACAVLEASHRLSETDVYQKCIEKIKVDMKAAINSDAFESLCRNCVKHITSFNDVNMSEEDLYEKVVRWSEAECMRQKLDKTWENKRLVLGDILYNIRFPIMDKYYFAENLGEAELLTHSEKVEILMYHCTSTNITHTLFSHKSRRGVSTLVSRFKNLDENMWTLSGNIDAISFEVSHKSLLHGIAVYGSSKETCVYDINVKIKNNAMHELLNHQQKLTTDPADGKGKLYEVKLKPLQIKAGVRYTVEMKMVGRIPWYGVDGENTVTYGNGKSVSFIKKRHLCYARTDTLPLITIVCLLIK